MSEQNQDMPSGSGVTSSLTDLLKKHDVALSTVKANRVLLENGILEEAERVSSKSGKVKKYKILTEQGLRIGENRESAHSDQTSPYYYDNVFSELVGLFEEHIKKEEKAKKAKD